MSSTLQVVRRAGSLRLYAIAGFPKVTVSAVLKRLDQHFPSLNMRFLGTPAGTGGGEPYGRNTAEVLLRSVAAFALRHRANSERENRALAPGRIVLLYVPALHDERLLGVFDYFCLPVPLEKPTHDGHRSDGWRLDPELAAKVVIDTVAKLEGENRPPPNLPRNAVATLPPDNFRPQRHDATLGESLVAIRRGELTMEELERRVEMKKFRREELPDIIREAPRKRFFLDYRGIVFPPAVAESGDHAPPRELPHDADIAAIQGLMNRLYRRGSPIERGFHHDVQYPNGRKLHDAYFRCRENGEILVSDTHANVYPNDVVRAAFTKSPKS